jgi:hypothetical protein
MEQLKKMYEKYQNAHTNASFYYWIEGEVRSIDDYAKNLGFASSDELKRECKKMAKTK